ncbi:MAG: hypothetical protein HY785_10015 [Oscillatoriophycideae cyanobacterium NC_groundwater_1537_Pr4_S-0.65um_50_18]|nr:hypothetical protein [Oscillatoriophycideae cyanobacterium NC_groundwater_1537_Pr4_S-0.65um_50_18]
MAIAFTAQDRESNNTFGTAQNLGGISVTGAREARTGRVRGNVSFSDTDVFRFLPGNQGSSKLTINLAGITGTASLFHDADGDRQFDVGELIASGNSSSPITLEGVGNNELFVQVSKGGAAANYTLDITVEPKVGRELEPNNIPSQATNIGRLSGSRHFQGTVDGTRDRSDFYAFRLDASRRVSLSLSDPKFSAANANLILYRDANNNKVIDSGEFVASSTGTRSNELIQRQLGSGNYFVQAFGVQNSISVDYTLNMSAR